MKRTMFFILFAFVFSIYSNAQNSYKLGKEKFKLFNYNEAIENFSNYIDQYKTSTSIMDQVSSDDSYLYRAICYLYTYELDKSISDIDEYFKRKGTMKEYASPVRAVALYFKQDYKGSLDELNKCLTEFDKQKADALFYRALVYRHLNNTDGYNADLNKIIEVDKKSDYKAFALQLTGKPDEALQYLLKSIEKEANAQKYYDLAALYAMQNKKSEAIMTMDKFLTMGFKPYTISLDEAYSNIINEKEFINILAKYNVENIFQESQYLKKLNINAHVVKTGLGLVVLPDVLNKNPFYIKPGNLIYLVKNLTDEKVDKMLVADFKKGNFDGVEFSEIVGFEKEAEEIKNADEFSIKSKISEYKSRLKTCLVKYKNSLEQDYFSLSGNIYNYVEKDMVNNSYTFDIYKKDFNINTNKLELFYPTNGINYILTLSDEVAKKLFSDNDANFCKFINVGKLQNKLNGYSSSFETDSVRILIYKSSQFNKKFNDYVTQPVFSITLSINENRENKAKQKNSNNNTVQQNTNKSFLTINGKTYSDVKSLWLSYKKGMSEISLSFNNEVSLILVNANAEPLGINKKYNVEIKILTNKQVVSNVLKGTLLVKKPTKSNCNIECFEGILSGTNENGDKVNVYIETELSPSE